MSKNFQKTLLIWIFFWMSRKNFHAFLHSKNAKLSLNGPFWAKKCSKMNYSSVERTSNLTMKAIDRRITLKHTATRHNMQIHVLCAACFCSSNFARLPLLFSLSLISVINAAPWANWKLLFLSFFFRFSALSCSVWTRKGSHRRRRSMASAGDSQGFVT